MTKTNQSGFSIVEALLILVIIGILGFTGWFVYHAKQVSDKNYSAASNSTTSTSKKKTVASDPYAGWKTGQLKYEQISYRYPSDWTVTDTSQATNLTHGCVIPGFDIIILTSPSDHQVELRSGVDCIGDGGATAYDAIPLKALGQSSYLVFESPPVALGSSATGPAYACLSKTSTADNGVFFGNSEHVTSDANSKPLNRFCYYPYNISKVDKAGTGAPSSSVASIKSSPDFDAAVLAFESMKYTSK